MKAILEMRTFKIPEMEIWQVKLTIMKFYPNLLRTFFNFKTSRIKISKMNKIKIHI